MSETEKKKIRFIDSKYNTLFYIEDGGNVVVTYADGEKLIRLCKYLDEYHVQIGSNVYHICEFAEKMERIGSTYAPESAPSLPDMCYSVLPSSGKLIIIEKEQMGYGECGFSTANPEQNRMLATNYNDRGGVTPQQEAAMVGGSMFGWNTPAAQTSSYDVRGNPVVPIKPKPEQKQILDNFLNNSSDAFAIFQLKDDDNLRDIRFEPMSRIQAAGRSVEFTNYNPVYTNCLTFTGSTPEKLEALFFQFNNNRPTDFNGHSLSVSDVVALKQNGTVSCHYVDSFGFQKLPCFLKSPAKCRSGQEQRKTPVKPARHKKTHIIER